ncbi:MAG: VIT1/CCC1 transporter family protein [Bacteroidetes bacterium]|nr:VIT1/CCC1 transporter family protein [Bacteroidota bacterium]
MPTTHHTEQHFTSGEIVRDIVIGMSDGLTVPFALAAGLSGAIDSSGIIITAGLAEIAAGSIAMGLGGYLAARSDSEHYASERRKEQEEVVRIPDVEKHEVAEVFEQYGITSAESAQVVEALARDPEKWVDFMMRFELGLEEVHPKRARNSAATIAVSYVLGGLVPLSPYIFIESARNALVVSVIVTLLALLVFGIIKGRFTGAHPIRSGFQTMLIGGLAAAAAFLIARLIA